MSSEEVTAWLEPLFVGAEDDPDIDLWGRRLKPPTPYPRCPSRMWPTGWVGGRTCRTSPWSWTGSSSASCSAKPWGGHLPRAASPAAGVNPQTLAPAATPRRGESMTGFG